LFEQVSGAKVTMIDGVAIHRWLSHRRKTWRLLKPSCGLQSDAISSRFWA
jgi:hypothetical protein